MNSLPLSGYSLVWSFDTPSAGNAKLFVPYKLRYSLSASM